MASRNYRLYYFGQLVSNTGTWMQRVAQAWLVLQLTDSPLALGTVSALQFLPMLLLSLFGGVIADRMPKRRLLLITQSAMTCQAIAIAVLTTSGQIQLWHVYVLALILGLATTLDNPVRQAFVVEMVGPADLPNAVALNSSLFNATRLVGPAVAGSIIAASSLAFCFWLNALSYVAVIWALLAIRQDELQAVPRPRRGRMLDQVREGLRFALGTRDICVMMILLVAVGTFGQNFQIFVPLLARYTLDVGPFGLGLMFSCLAGGSLLAALGQASRQATAERTALVAVAVFSVMLMLVGLSPWLLLTCALLIVQGGANILFNAVAQTRLQLLTPGELRGRVMSLYMLVSRGVTPFGSLFVGTMSEHFGVRWTMLSSAVLCGLGLLVALLYARRRSAGRELAALSAERGAS